MTPSTPQQILKLWIAKFGDKTLQFRLTPDENHIEVVYPVGSDKVNVAFLSDISPKLMSEFLLPARIRKETPVDPQSYELIDTDIYLDPTSHNSSAVFSYICQRI